MQFTLVIYICRLSAWLAYFKENIQNSRFSFLITSEVEWLNRLKQPVYYDV